ncbi:MAG: FG-GAP-like repeat-containing protein [Leptolyngbyaceae cyanobacterium]
MAYTHIPADWLGGYDMTDHEARITDLGTYTLGSGEVEFDNAFVHTGTSNEWNWGKWRYEKDYKFDFYSQVKGNSLDNVIYGNTDRAVHIADEGNKKIYRTLNALTGSYYETIWGYDGNDTIFGLEGNDKIYGGNDHDYINGGKDSDWLYGGNGNDVIASGSLMEGHNDKMWGGAGKDTFFIGDANPETRTNGGNLDWGALALGLADYALDFTVIPGLGTAGKVVKDFIPMVVDVLKNDFDGAETYEVLSPQGKAAEYVSIEDFNYREDVAIIPVSATGDPNVKLEYNEGDGTIDLSYYGGITFGKIKLEGSFDKTIKEDIIASMMQNVLILDNEGTVKLGGGGQSSNVDLAGVSAPLNQLGNQFIVLGAYGHQELMGSNAKDRLYGTDNGNDIFYGYGVNVTDDPNTLINEAESSNFTPWNGLGDEFFGHGGDDLFFAGGGADIIRGGDGTDTVSYVDANGNPDNDLGIVVDLSAGKATDDGFYRTQNIASNGTIQNVGVSNPDSLYGIENIIGSRHDDTITGDANANVLEGGEGEDTLTGKGGADIFVLRHLTVGNADTIKDFSLTDGDRIQINVVDNNGNATITSSDRTLFSTSANGSGLDLEYDGTTIATLENVSTSDFDLDHHLFFGNVGERNTGALHDSGATLVGAGDVTGDGFDDLVWHLPNGQVYAQEVVGGAITRGFEIGPAVSSVNELVGVGDFDNDGTDDLLWSSTSVAGRVRALAWKIVDGQLVGETYELGSVPDNNTLIGAGDFNGDGTDDLLWSAASNGGVQAIGWEVDNFTEERSYHINSPAASTNALVGAGDFNKDGTDDLLWADSGATSGKVRPVIWEIEDEQVVRGLGIGSGVNSASNTLTGVAGDFNNNGTDDMVWESWGANDKLVVWGIQNHSQHGHFHL